MPPRRDEESVAKSCMGTPQVKRHGLAHLARTLGQAVAFVKILMDAQPSTPPVRAARCGRCKRWGHSKSVCEARPCFQCGSIEHKARVCPKPKRCYRCGELGHVRAECGRKRATEAEDPGPPSGDPVPAAPETPLPEESKEGSPDPSEPALPCEGKGHFVPEQPSPRCRNGAVRGRTCYNVRPLRSSSGDGRGRRMLKHEKTVLAPEGAESNGRGSDPGQQKGETSLLAAVE
jgi:hypothetical protein